MFSVRFVCLSAVLWKNYWLDFHETWWKGVARVKEEPIMFWSGSESQGRYTHYFSLMVLGLRSPSAPLVLNVSLSLDGGT